jgi:hypothetical protein
MPKAKPLPRGRSAAVAGCIFSLSTSVFYARNLSGFACTAAASRKGEKKYPSITNKSKDFQMPVGRQRYHFQRKKKLKKIAIGLY